MKHYQNDYKKLIGFDQNRTASEKLLDRNISKREPLSVGQKIEGEDPKKKVKRQRQRQRQREEELSQEDIINKIIKALASKNQTKIQKGLQILNKCFQQTQFKASIKLQQIKEIINQLVQQSDFAVGTPVDTLKICELKRASLNGLKNIFEESFQQNTLLEDMHVQMHVDLFSLVTDDNFQFTKHLTHLKESIWKIFQSQSQTQGTEGKTFVEDFLFRKIFSIPILHSEWARTGLNTFFKQFIVDHKQKLKRPKEFLIQYNKFIQGKKNAVQTTGVDVMGKKVKGGSYSTVEYHDPASSWCKKQ